VEIKMKMSARRTDEKKRSRQGNRAGFTLIEVLVALVIMGMTAAFIGGVYTALNASQVNKEYINAENLAKSQMESVMKQQYITVENYDPADPDNSYEIINIPQPLLDQGYEIYMPAPVVVQGTTDNATIQKITVEVRLDENDETKTIIKLVDYKLNYAQQ
jgi:prepilin-type N-terminal cleavage/methylation domain-containing protein